MEETEDKKYCEIAPYTLTIGQKIYVGFKAIMDFLIAFFSLLIFIIPFGIIGIAIKLDSKGPVFFKCPKIGKDGKIYTMYKFRSMTTDTRPDIATSDFNDVSHITKVGRFLRDTSIDELPQLFCLLTGKMSLIGYRPSFKSETELNTAREGFNMYQIRPGITGWAQINGRDVLGAHPTLKAQYDGYYLKNISLKLDVKIFFMTIMKVLKRSDIKEGEIEGLEK